MIKPRRFALIPARKGSKGLRNKNSRTIAGYPLISWSVSVALESKCFDDVIISTDDSELANIAVIAGGTVPFLRPSDLADDKSTSTEVALHAADKLGWRDIDEIVLLQPTSPLRISDDIIGCIDLLHLSKAPAVISICEASVPLEWYKLLNSDKSITPAIPDLENKTRRQDATRHVVPNGAVYAIRISNLKRYKSFSPPGTLGFEMPKGRSVDIDDIFDFMLAEQLLYQRMLSESGV